MASSVVTSASSSAKPRRRWYQFSLRTVIVWMVLLCLLLGSFAWWRDRAERQRKVVEELEGMGVIVFYDNLTITTQTIDGEVVDVVTPEFFLCAWLRRCLGDDYLYDVGAVTIPEEVADSPLRVLKDLPHIKKLNLRGKAVSALDLQQLPWIETLEELSFPDFRSIQVLNNDLVVLERATSLRRLSLVGQPVGDAGLKHLCNCKRLQELSLSNTNVRDGGLQHLSELSELVRLDLENTQVTDVGLKHLRSLNRLAVLSLFGDAVTGEGLANLGCKPKLILLDISYSKLSDSAMQHLKQFPMLREVRLGNANVTGTGLVHFANLAKLERIDLSSNPLTDDGIAGAIVPEACQSLDLTYTNVTDKGFCQLKLPSGLTQIFLNNTSVTDAALEHLQPLPNLESVSLYDTQVTLEGIKRFEAGHPDCRVLSRVKIISPP